ncbi:MAG: transketolase [Ruminococcus sp.]|nr:transketolase [Ruminococcus sp.]
MNSEQLAWLIRRHGVEMTHLSHGSHIGAIFSVADIMGVLYADILRYDARDPAWDGRDRFILSKGHAGAALYAALAECGFIDREELKTHYCNGSRLSGHVSHLVPGVDFSTGSLGHGLAVAAGRALAAKQDGKSFRSFAVLGDGECNEGEVWESAEFANHFRLDNLIAVIDYNHLQSLDFCNNTLEVEMARRWAGFGWHVMEVDGHDHRALREALTHTDNPEHKPTVIVAHTVKGKGVSFMENDVLWHYRFPHDGWEYNCTVNELHAAMPAGVTDPYTPDGCPEMVPQPEPGKHVASETYHPTFYHREVEQQ